MVGGGTTRDGRGLRILHLGPDEVCTQGVTVVHGAEVSQALMLSRSCRAARGSERGVVSGVRVPGWGGTRLDFDSVP